MSKNISAFNKILYLLSFGDKTTFQIINKLSAYEYTQAEIDRALTLATETDLLNDLRFAVLFSESKRKHYWPAYKIKVKLKYLGISQEIIDNDLKDILGDEQELKTAMLYLGNFSDDCILDKSYCLKKLLNKGFSYKHANLAVNTFLTQSH